MRVRVRVPLETVDIFLNDMTREDIRALLVALDPDRNHPARAKLYEQLNHAALILDKDPYSEFG